MVVGKLVLFTGRISGCRGGNGIGSFSEGSSVLLNPSCIQGQNCRMRSLKTVSNIITDILNEEPEQSVGDVFKTHFSEGNGNFEDKIKKMTGSGLGIKRKRKIKSVSRQTWEGKGYCHRIEDEELMECLKSGLGLFHKRGIQTSVVKSHRYIKTYFICRQSCTASM